MAQALYTVEQVAEQLNLHVKTVRNYVREGRLKAVRVGKQYRISGEDLAALTGCPVESLAPEPVRRERYVEVSSIVEIDAISPESVNRLANVWGGAAMSQRGNDQNLRVESIYNTERARLKVIVTGSLATVTSLLSAITFLLEQV